MILPPLSLYIHIPWCEKKCPYCDFNSHQIRNTLPEEQYLQRLLFDIQQDLIFTQQRKIESIFIGGGTPSVMSANFYYKLLSSLSKIITFSDHIEITMEVNPNSATVEKFAAFFDAGINRLSIGVQSFSDILLQRIGRLHDAQQAIKTIDSVHAAGFTNFNIDIMYGLPQQSIDEVVNDLQQCIALSPTHISWYQLTLEPNTVFYRKPPKLPVDEMIFNMQNIGLQQLQQAGFNRYEVSAFTRNNNYCQHNLNYWQFGDYLAIGAGAHGKITQIKQKRILRYSKQRSPMRYLDWQQSLISQKNYIAQDELSGEFMLNALRLIQGIQSKIYVERTGLDLLHIQNICHDAVKKKLLHADYLHKLQATNHGINYLNDLLLLFL